MKVFEYNFKSGKGKHIANIKCTGNGCIIGKHKNYPVYANFTIISYLNDEPFHSEPLTSDNFTTDDAIIFCTGKNNYTKEWNWVMIPTKNMIEKAKARNREIYGTEHHNPDFVK